MLSSSFSILHVCNKIFLIQNTGAALNLIEGYRWFVQWLIPKSLPAVKVALIILTWVLQVGESISIWERQV